MSGLELPQRVIVFSNLNGDILRFKTLLVLTGLAQVDGGSAEADTGTPHSAVPTTAKDTVQGGEAVSAAVRGQRPLTAATPAATLRTIDAPGEPMERRHRRAARAAAAAKALDGVSTGRLRLTDACTHTSIILLGNSVGRHPHSHEVIDLFAQLRREAVETLEGCELHYVLGKNELSFLSGDMPALRDRATVAPSAVPTARTVASAPSPLPLSPTVSIRERQWERHVLLAFDNDETALRESYSPYGHYGRFILSNHNVMLRLGDTVFAHGGVVAPFSHLGVRRINAAFLESCKELYGDAHAHTQPPPQVCAAGACSTPAAGSRDEAQVTEKGVDTYANPFSALHGSPLHDQSLILAAAGAGDCAPVERALAELARAEGTAVRRLVVAGSAATTAAVAAAAEQQRRPSPLAAPVSLLCGGSLVVVSGGERSTGLIAALELRSSEGAAAAAAAPAGSLSPRALYPLGTRTLVTYDHLRQPVAAPRGARTVRPAHGEGRRAEEAAGAAPGRQAQPLHVLTDAVADEGGRGLARRGDPHSFAVQRSGAVESPLAVASAVDERDGAAPLTARSVLRGLRRSAKGPRRVDRAGSSVTIVSGRGGCLLLAALLLSGATVVLLRLTRSARSWLLRTLVGRGHKAK